MKQLFRLEIDENGEASAADFSNYANALDAWRQACKRKAVFSARIDRYDVETFVKQTTVTKFERK